MKKILAIALLLISVVYTTIEAQCGDELLKKTLKEMGDSQYMKDFSIELSNVNKDAKTGYVKFSVILNSRTHYKFNTTDGAGNSEKVIMQLYDGDKMMASNYDGGKMYQSFEFVCQKSKVYNLVFSYQGGAEGCSKAVMSMVKQYAEGEMKF